MRGRLLRLLKDPWGVLKTRVSLFLAPFKYRTPEGYDAEMFWGDRLSKYGSDLRGVGVYGLTHNENLQMYVKAKDVFLALCREEEIDFRSASVLDIGCGTGFYTRALLENGVKQYLGVDITDKLFGGLRQEAPEFQFRKLDITREELAGRFDLILMIDVTQHITNDEKFAFAMGNVRRHLSENGVLIATSWLDDKTRRSFYEKSRSMNRYKAEFPGHAIGKPVPFRDKFVFSVRNRGAERHECAKEPAAGAEK